MTTTTTNGNSAITKEYGEKVANLLMSMIDR